VNRVWLRAAALALAAGGAVAGLTVYFSTQTVPRCLVSGAPDWKAPLDGGRHRYEVVVLKDDACFFDMDRKQKLAGALPLERATWLLAHVPPSSDTVRVTDVQHRVVYETKRGLFGVRVLSVPAGRRLFVVHYEGFAWNPRFGPDPPSHGLSLAPDRPELWVLDAPNSVVHLFDVSALPNAPPVRLEDIRLSKPLSGDESPCSESCRRIGSLLHSADGRFVYVGDAGDVIDTRTREVIANLEALHNSRVQLEVDWVNGRAVFPRPS
jgi:hypothetical protein